MDAFTGEKAEPIDLRLVEMIHREDPGWWLHSLAGCFYHMARRSIVKVDDHQLRQPGNILPPDMKFTLDCEPTSALAHYTNIYLRWLVHSPHAEGMKNMLLREPNTGFGMNLKRAMYRGRLAMAENLCDQCIRRHFHAGFIAEPPNTTPFERKLWQTVLLDPPSTAGQKLVAAARITANEAQIRWAPVMSAGRVQNSADACDRIIMRDAATRGDISHLYLPARSTTSSPRKRSFSDYSGDQGEQTNVQAANTVLANPDAPTACSPKKKRPNGSQDQYQALLNDRRVGTAVHKAKERVPRRCGHFADGSTGCADQRATPNGSMVKRGPNGTAAAPSVPAASLSSPVRAQAASQGHETNTGFQGPQAEAQTTELATTPQILIDLTSIAKTSIDNTPPVTEPNRAAASAAASIGSSATASATSFAGTPIEPPSRTEDPDGPFIGLDVLNNLLLAQNEAHACLRHEAVSQLCNVTGRTNPRAAMARLLYLGH